MDDAIQQLRELISARTGIYLRSGDEGKFENVVRGRARSLGLPGLTEYLQQLRGTHAGDEWERLAVELIPGESYFFRDRGQMRLIENVLLPELLQRRGAGRELRIWSAGCSTGEEPYSIAALLTRVLPNQSGWKITILGTDSNPEALAHARRGLYNKWSFRQVQEHDRREFFEADGPAFRVRPDIRALVSFELQNLHSDDYPAGNIRDFDLIVCRNVFIYMRYDVIAAVAEKMQRCLRDEGFLLTGHGELSGSRPKGLSVRVFPESIVFQKGQDDAPPRVSSRGALFNLGPAGLAGASPRTKRTSSYTPSPVNAPRPPPPESPAIARRPSAEESAPAADLSELRRIVRTGDTQAALEGLVAYLADHPDDAEAADLLARAHADRGDHDRAAMILNDSIKASPFRPQPYFWLSRIAEEQGDRQRAEELLRRALYLDPEYAPAYLELASLYDLDGERERSERQRRLAMDLLKTLDPGTEIEEYGGETAGQFLERLLA